MTLKKNFSENRKSIIVFFFTLIIGWLVYYTIFFLASHFYEDWFRDFFEVNRAAAQGDSYLTGACANYPPLALVLAKIIALFIPNTLKDSDVYVTIASAQGKLVFIAFFSIILFISYKIIYEYCTKHMSLKGYKLFLFTFGTLFSYSLFFALERGNYILLSFIAFMVFVFTYEDHEVISAISLAICACLKIYPVLLIAIFFLDKKYKGFITCIITGIIGLFVPMIFLKGNILQQFMGIINAVLLFNGTSQQAKGEVSFAYVEQHSNSLSNIFRAIALHVDNSPLYSNTKSIVIDVLKLSYNISLLILIAVSIYTLLKTHTLWKRICIITCLLLLIPNNTYDYMLTYFIPILIMAICDQKNKNHFYIFTIAYLAYIPKSYYFFEVGVLDVSIQCVLNPIIMLVLIGHMFIDCLKEEKVLIIPKLSDNDSFSISVTNVIKGFAICQIVYFHAISCMGSDSYQILNYSFNKLYGQFGNIGVVFFVFLTTYGYTIQSKKELSEYGKEKPYLKFIQNKLSNLYKQYWFVFIFACILSIFLSPNWMDIRLVYQSSSIIKSIGRFICNFLGLTHLIYGDNAYTLNQTWWYISLSVVLIIIIPIIFRFYRKYKAETIIFCLSFSLILGKMKYMQYLFAVIFGIIFAEEDLFIKIKRTTQKYYYSFVVFLCLLGLLLLQWYKVRINPNTWDYYIIADSIFAIGIITFIYCYLYRFIVIKNIFEFIGKHSGNIFLIHSFIYLYYPKISSFVYGFHYDILIWLVTILFSLVISILLEWLKKILHWNILFNKISEKRFSIIKK